MNWSDYKRHYDVNDSANFYDLNKLFDTYMEARGSYMGSYGEDDECLRSVDMEASSVASRSAANDPHQQNRSCINHHGSTGTFKDNETGSGGVPTSVSQWEHYFQAASKVYKVVVSPTTRFLDEVLMSFSKQPRCLVEAMAPFRLVHANAAYQKLASELIVGTEAVTPCDARSAAIMGLRISHEQTSLAVIYAVRPGADKAVSHYLVELLPSTMVQVLG
jgi:hypothetical protein